MATGTAAFVDREARSAAGEAGTLDPADWGEVRAIGHRMLDDMFDYVEGIRGRPAWKPIPEEVRARFRGAPPAGASSLEAVYQEFRASILPYVVGNAHPGFLGWVHGGGTVTGMLAEMLAGGLNANLGGRDQIPIEVERQVAEWMRRIFGFPEGAAGLFVTGTSMANLVALLVARRAALGEKVRAAGTGCAGKRLMAYTSRAAHECIAKGMDLAGLGTDALRRIGTDASGRMRLGELREAIGRDRAAGLTPFLIVGTAGSVDIGGIDDLDGLAETARAEGMWFHVDGALGALAVLAPELAGRLRGIERADSLAFDFHKWMQVPYDAGFVLVRDGRLQLETFASPAAYLRREARGTAAGSPWPCDLGPDLSRGFRALKTWFTIRVYGTRQLGATIARCCRLAQYLKRQVEARPELELAAPVGLNIVCFRYRGEGNEGNARIAADIQESGIAVPSTTVIDGRLAIRAAIVNHRTEARDLDALVEAVLEFGRNGQSIRVGGMGTGMPAERASPEKEPRSSPLTTMR